MAQVNFGTFELVSDLSPQLGNVLDTNDHSIVSTGNNNIEITPNALGNGVINLNKDTNIDGDITADNLDTVAIAAHLIDFVNPHVVTKTQVGLSVVPNTDFTASVDLNNAHRIRTDNPHVVTRTQLGLATSDEPIFANVTSSNLATANSHLVRLDQMNSAIAGLDWQPSVLNFYDPTASTPSTPSTGDRYISLATVNGWTLNNIYEWSGTAWTPTVPNTGFTVWVEAVDTNYTYNSSGDWVEFGSTVSHNNTTGLQGGQSGEYYHLTATTYTYIDQDVTTTGTPTFASLQLTTGATIVSIDTDLNSPLDTGVPTTKLVTDNFIILSNGISNNQSAINSHTLWLDSLSIAVSDNTNDLAAHKISATPHTQIDQNVLTTSSPTFARLNTPEVRATTSAGLKLYEDGDLGIFIQDGTGNVGVNQNTPGAKMDILSTANTQPVLKITGTGTADLVNIFDDTTEVFTILDGGTVGIGTTSPDEKLSVNGAITLTTNGTRTATGTHTTIDHYVTDGQCRILVNGILNGPGAGSGDRGEFTIALRSPTNTLAITPFKINYNGWIGVGDTSAIGAQLHVVSSGISAYVAHFENTNAGGSYGVRIKAGAETGEYILSCTDKNDNTAFYIRGDRNVGIGTTSPSEKLQVSGTCLLGSSPYNYISSLSSPTDFVLGYNCKSHSSTELTSGPISASTIKPQAILLGPTTGIRFVTTSDNNVADTPFTINTQERMRIDIDGNVGIGTTDPVSKFEVKTTGIVSSDPVATITNTNITTGDRNGLYINSGWDSDDYAFRCYNANYGQLFTIQGDGNVGIGTTSPATNLNIDGTDTATNFGLRIAQHGTGDAIVGLFAGSIGWSVGVDNSDGDKFKISRSSTNLGTNNAITIDTNNYVGIGTTSPDYKLETAGSIASVVDTADTFGLVIKNNIREWDILNSASVDYLYFYNRTLASTAMVVKGSNNYVGIGTTDPDEKLEVNGNILATGSIICGLKPHGEIYSYNNTTAQAITTSYATLVNFTALGSHDTGVTAVYSTGNIRADKAGLYKVTFSATIFHTSTSTLFTFAIHNDAVIETNMVQELDNYSVGNLISNITITGYVTVVAGKYVTVKVKGNSSDSITMRQGNFNIEYVTT